MAAFLISLGGYLLFLTQTEDLPIWGGMALAFVSALTVLLGVFAFSANTRDVARWAARVLFTLASALASFFIANLLSGRWEEALWGLSYVPVAILWVLVRYSMEWLEPEERKEKSAS